MVATILVLLARSSIVIYVTRDNKKLTSDCVLFVNFDFFKKIKMEFNEYQREARKTALYPEVGGNPIYPTLGLVGEAGEVADKVKKILRDNKGFFDDKSKDAIKFELGDVLWYISQLSSELGYELEDVANSNLQKLDSRKSRGKIQGSGDNR